VIRNLTITVLALMVISLGLSLIRAYGAIESMDAQIVKYELMNGYDRGGD
jgi:hypothetical protein